MAASQYDNGSVVAEPALPKDPFDMADTEDATQKDTPIPFPLLASAYLLFSALRHLAGPVRLVFSDSIVFLEAGSVSVLLSPGLKIEPSRPRSLCPLRKNLDPHSSFRRASCFG
ncbi:hypothetical protein V4R08_16290 (plasmid) [Nitrobacter sp. NHB1]|uniref:hypothetical protein n=1 Tax=Nitrobacter sp. NHB1 TaxID=3119830 RepID=UPI002FFECF98